MNTLKNILAIIMVAFSTVFIFLLFLAICVLNLCFQATYVFWPMLALLIPDMDLDMRLIIAGLGMIVFHGVMRNLGINGSKVHIDFNSKR